MISRGLTATRWRGAANQPSSPADLAPRLQSQSTSSSASWLRAMWICGHPSSGAAALASRSLAPMTVPPELTGRGGLGPQVAWGPNSRKKS
jgi:hypothetical protein